MRRLMVAALSALILLCEPLSTLHRRGLHSSPRTPLLINLFQVGAPAATSLRPGAPLQASASESGERPSAQEGISLESGNPIARELSGGQSHSYKITVISG